MIDGPRIPPASGGKAASLVVFLHGFGADGNDLIEIGRRLGPQLPETAFVAPNAPDICPGVPNGRQWFPLVEIDPQRLYSDVSGSAPAVDAFLDAELARHELGDGDLALVGFSQGTMMALHVAPRRTGRVAGVVGYSGLLAGPERLADETVTKPPVLLVHGQEDPVIPAMAQSAAVRALGGAGFATEWHIRPGLLHGIDAEGLRLGADFLRRTLS